MTPRHAVRRSLATLAVAPLALGLVACGGDGSDDTADTASDPSATVTVTEDPSDDATATATDEPGGSGSQDAGQGGSAGDGALEAAATTALAEVAGATLVGIDRDDDGDDDWDVTLVDGEGVEFDVEVSPDGGSVTRGPDREDDDDDDDRRDDQRLLDASVDYLTAIETARGEVPDLEVTGAELESDDGRLRWDVDLGDDRDDDLRTVRIDAGSGEVIGSDRDDDGDDDRDDRDDDGDD